MTEDLFREFMELAWKYEKTTKPNKVQDIKIDDYVIARIGDNKCTVWYLLNGSRIVIPWDWIDLFSSFNTHSGHKVLFAGPENEVISKTIYYFTKLVICFYQENGKGFIEALSEIPVTEKFREWVDKEFGLTLDPLEYYSINQYTII